MIFFYGVATNGVCGAGFVIKLDDDNEIKGWLKAGRGSNTQTELVSLWSRLFVAISRGLKDIHVVGDSQVIINWA